MSKTKAAPSGAAFFSFYFFFRYDVIAVFRYNGIAVFRYDEIILNPPRSVAFRIGTAAPEFFARVDTLPYHLLNHWTSALGTLWSAVGNAFLRPRGKSFCRKGLREATLFAEGIQLILYLLAEHHNQSVTKNQNAVGRNQRVATLKPSVKFAFLLKNMNAAQMQHIISICRAVKGNAAHIAIFCGMYRPWHISKMQ